MDKKKFYYLVLRQQQFVLGLSLLFIGMSKDTEVKSSTLMGNLVLHMKRYRSFGDGLTKALFFSRERTDTPVSTRKEPPPIVHMTAPMHLREASDVRQRKLAGHIPSIQATRAEEPAALHVPTPKAWDLQDAMQCSGPYHYSHHRRHWWPPQEAPTNRAYLNATDKTIEPTRMVHLLGSWYEVPNEAYELYQAGASILHFNANLGHGLPPAQVTIIQ